LQNSRGHLYWCRQLANPGDLCNCAGRPDTESQVGSQVVGHSPATPYTTLGEVAAELRRMKADGVTRESLLYALDRVYAA
jgi:hypothetical protein